MTRRRIAWLLALTLLAACQPEATPLPAFIPPTQSPTPAPTDEAPIRYALEPNTDGAIEEIDLLREAGDVTLLSQPAPVDLVGAAYEVIAGYGDISGWTLSPVTSHVSLVIAPLRAPLNEDAVIAVIRESLDPEALVAALGIPGAQPDALREVDQTGLRERLANAGWPDGFDVTLANAFAPGAAPVVGQLRAVGLNAAVRSLGRTEAMDALRQGRADMALVTWTTPETRAEWTALMGETSVIDLYTVPIRFLAAEGLNVTFTPGGWPLASR